MTDPKRVEAECARIIIAHMAQVNGTVAKAHYADALQKRMLVQQSGRSVGSVLSIDVCEWCAAPFVNSITRQRCNGCRLGHPCRGIWCIREKVPSQTLTCVFCQGTDFCPHCIQPTGCTICGTPCCRSCAFVGEDAPIDPALNRRTVEFLVCTRECGLGLPKPVKRAKQDDDDEMEMGVGDDEEYE